MHLVAGKNSAGQQIMHNDEFQDKISRQSDDGILSQSEIAATAWSKLLGDLPSDFYERVSFEGRAAIRTALDREITAMCNDRRRAQAEHEKVVEDRGTSGESLKQIYYAKRAWENVTRFDTYHYEEIRPEYRDRLLEEWQEEISLGPRELDDHERIEVQNNQHEDAVSRAVNIHDFQELLVKEHSDRSYTVEREAASGPVVSSSSAESSQRLADIQDRVANWWNREHGKALFGPEVHVVDYPRSDDWNRWTEDFDQELELEFFINGADFQEHNIGSLEHGVDSSSVSTEHNINRLLFDDAISFDQINRPNGLESHGDVEQIREDDLQFERSDWNERGR